MMSKGLVSIIIPCFNCENFIEKCIKSIINQSYTSLELLLINDGSTDNTLSILKSYKTKDCRIKIFSQKNQGVSYARNVGIRNATGKFLAFIDSDDCVEGDYIENLINSIKDNDLCIGGFKYIIDNQIKELHIPSGIEGYQYKYMVVWGKLYRKDFLLKNSLLFKDHFAEDILFSIECYNCTNKITYIKNSGYIYIYNTESVTATARFNINKNLDLYKKILASENYKKDFFLEFSFFKILIQDLIDSFRNLNLINYLKHKNLIMNYLKRNNINLLKYSKWNKSESFWLNVLCYYFSLICYLFY